MNQEHPQCIQPRASPSRPCQESGIGHLPSSSVHLWKASLDVPPAVLSAYASLLSPDEAGRAARFVYDQHRNRYIAGRGVLRKLLGDYTGTDPVNIAIEVSEHGKPVLRESAGIEFNISHSGAMLVLAFARSRVGVDVEEIRPMPDALEIAERFFSPIEIEQLRTCPEQNRVTAFFTCWTRKEAYIKARGEGLSIPLASFTVSLDPEHPSIQDASPWTLAEIPRIPGYAAALAVEGPATITHWRPYVHQGNPLAVE